MADEMIPILGETVDMSNKKCANCQRVIGPEEHALFGNEGDPYCSTACMLNRDAYGVSTYP